MAATGASSLLSVTYYGTSEKNPVPLQRAIVRDAAPNSRAPPQEMGICSMRSASRGEHQIRAGKRQG